MRDRTLSRADITALLDELAVRLRKKGTFAKLHVVGGACMALAYERDRSTEDVDARVDAGHEALEEAIREVAHEHDLPERWLNDQARGFIPEGDDGRSPTLYESQSLIVTGASAEHLLAMKLEASRAKDQDDIRVLLEHLGTTDADRALEQHHALFPNSRRTSAARALLARLAQDDDRLTPPTPIEILRERWQQTLAAETFPRYEIEHTQKGFVLTVQEQQEGPTKVLGESESLYILALRQRTHRGWPHEATEIIRKFTERALAQRKRGSEEEQRRSPPRAGSAEKWSEGAIADAQTEAARRKPPAAHGERREENRKDREPVEPPRAAALERAKALHTSAVYENAPEGQENLKETIKRAKRAQRQGKSKA